MLIVKLEDLGPEASPAGLETVAAVQRLEHARVLLEQQVHLQHMRVDVHWVHMLMWVTPHVLHVGLYCMDMAALELNNQLVTALHPWT